ncbi:MAG: Ger(x)C family spore germination protein [Desulfosporosinus sp.]|nr:Ger(x)C family spore germination protein [Desulfosporosinus sp.]
MKGNKSLIGVILLLIGCILFLTGCWGKREVEELAPLMGVGIDLGQKPGTYLITQQFAIPTKGAGAPEIKDWTVSIEASSAREVTEKVSLILNRIPFMGSLMVIVIGEDAARANFNDLLDFTQRYSKFRRTMYLTLAKGKAQDILTLKLRKGEIPAMFIKSNIETADDFSTFPTVRLGHYLTVLGDKSTAPILPIVESIKPGEEGYEYQAKGSDGAQEVRIQGAGVLKGGHLVDSLTDEETKGYMWLDDDVINRYLSTANVAKSNLTFAGQVLNSKTKYKVLSNNGTMEIQYHIESSIGLDEVMGLKEQLPETEWVDLMKGVETSFAKAIQKECELSIKKEKESGLDFLGIGRHIEQRQPAYWKTIKDQWEQKIADFPVSIDVQVTVHHTGMSSSSAATN